MAFLDLDGLSRFKTKLEGLFIKGPSSSTSNAVAIFDGTGGKTIKNSGFTIGKSVPSDAKFTDTTYSEATTSAAGLMSSSDKTKLNGIATGAEVNQNAFSNVVVGSTTIAADGKTDTLTLAAGSNVTLTPDATNDKITIAATDTNTWRPVSDSVSSTSSSDAASSKAVKTAYDLANGKVSATKANIDNALGVGSGAAKFYREDGTWNIPPGTKPYIVALDTVTNTSGSYTHTTSISNIRDDMKPIQIECSNPDAFQDAVNVITGNGSITLTCANVSGTSDVTVTVMESASAEQGIPGQVTSTEFNTLAERIGTLSQLTTTNKSSLVSAANELKSMIKQPIIRWVVHDSSTVTINARNNIERTLSYTLAGYKCCLICVTIMGQPASAWSPMTADTADAATGSCSVRIRNTDTQQSIGGPIIGLWLCIPT